MIERLGQHLKTWMISDIEEIHYSLRITTDVIQLLRAVEKYFGGNANYAKGKGSMFENWMKRYHPVAYLYAVSRACGGSRQDIGVEGAIAVFMNVPHYLEFLVWRMRCGHGDGILERNLYFMLRSVEMISFLRVLAILHISVCMPLRWLAAKCGELEKYNFGVADMATVVDIMDKAFFKVVNDGSKLLDEDFMMEMFKKLTKKLPPLREYLDFMFNEKRSGLVGSCTKEDRILPWDLLKSELFYPTRKDVLQTNSFCPDLASEAACIFRIEFRDETKATAKYLSSIDGPKSMKKVSKAERLAGRGVAASNCISESGHAAATYDLDQYGTVDLQNCAARGQSEGNNDFGREVESYVKGRKAFKERETRGIGGFHLLPPELQHTAIVTSKWNTKQHKEKWRTELKTQFDTRRRKEEITLEKKLDVSKEDHIEACFLFEQYHSMRRWKTKREAISIHRALKSESARLTAVKVNTVSFFVYLLSLQIYLYSY